MHSEASLQACPALAPVVSSPRVTGFAGPWRFAGSALLLAFALGCTVALCAWSGISLQDAAATLGSAPLWLIAAFVALTVAQVALSAWKWQLVLRKLRPGSDEVLPYGFLYNCTALAAFLSQFMTVYLAAIVVRGMALKRSYGMTARYGATTSLFEQVFDVMVFAIMVVPTLVVWTLGGSFEQWVVATATAIAAGALLLSSVWLVQRGGAWIDGLGLRIPRVAPLIELCVDSGLLSLPFVLKFYAISVLRYFTMLARIPLLVIAFRLPIDLADVVPGFTIVQATQLAAITPGQLGIREWTWSGVLALRGYDLQRAAHFAIDLRLIGTLAVTLATVTCVVGLRRRRS